jgi:Kef-type K+ transport system membrane component KefB
MQLETILIQIVVVLAAIRLLGWVCRKLRQPQVVGEMVAGILLGPSVLGLLAPRVEAFVFPEKSLPFLNTLSQVGLVLFLFAVGLEHDLSRLRSHKATAVIASHASIFVPFFLGSLLALLLYPRLSDDRVTFVQFSLFLGTAMSITAFPVLARILEERRLVDTDVGSTAIVCAAVDDVTGWLVVAGVLLAVGAQRPKYPLWATVPLVGLYAAGMIFGAPRLLRPLAGRCEARGGLAHGALAIVTLFAFASATATERLGIHPLFGAFLAGTAVPREFGFNKAVSRRLEDMTVVLLLPLFFAYSGLRTHVGLLRGPAMWLYFAAILAVAIAGKLGGATAAARATGMSWRESTAVGTLVNARGLVELVVLNIGLDAGLISPSLFAIMVLMAITTTVITTPLLDWIFPDRFRHASVPTTA